MKNKIIKITNTNTNTNYKQVIEKKHNPMSIEADDTMEVNL